MKNAKKICAVLMTCVMAMTMAACSGSKKEVPPVNVESTEKVTEETTVKETAASVETVQETGTEAGFETEAVSETEALASQSDKVTYCGWIKAVMPEDYEMGDYPNHYSIELPDKPITAAIDMEVNRRGSAQERVDHFLSLDGYTAGDDVVIGDLTWKVVVHTLSDQPCVTFIADIPGQEGTTAEIATTCRTADDEVLIKFLESVEFEDDAYEANQTFWSEYYSN